MATAHYTLAYTNLILIELEWRKHTEDKIRRRQTISTVDYTHTRQESEKESDEERNVTVYKGAPQGDLLDPALKRCMLVLSDRSLTPDLQTAVAAIMSPYLLSGNLYRSGPFSGRY